MKRRDFLFSKKIFYSHKTFLTESENEFSLSTRRTRDNLKTCGHTWSTRARNAIYVQTPAGSPGIELLALGGVIWDNHLGHVHTRDCRPWNFRSPGIRRKHFADEDRELPYFLPSLFQSLPGPEIDDARKKKAIETCLHEICFRDLYIYMSISDFYVICAKEVEELITLNLYRILLIHQSLAPWLICPCMREHEKSNRLQKNVGHGLNPRNMHLSFMT